jgi:transcriptional regulator with XRE-family HTH domain
VTPFGAKVRELRKQRKVSMKDMADTIGVTPAYLSALEHGHRGLPSWYLVQRIIAYFNVIWDEAEEITRLARLSHPRVVVDTSGLSPAATELANKLADNIASMSDEDIHRHLALLEEAIAGKSPSRE